MDCSRQGSSAHGIFQARILEWVDSSAGNLPNSGTELASPALQGDSLPLSHQDSTTVCNELHEMFNILYKIGSGLTVNQEKCSEHTEGRLFGSLGICQDVLFYFVSSCLMPTKIWSHGLKCVEQ